MFRYVKDNGSKCARFAKDRISVWRCLKSDERAVDTLAIAIARAGGRGDACCAKSEEKGRTADGGERDDESRGRVRERGVRRGGGDGEKRGMRGGS